MLSDQFGLKRYRAEVAVGAVSAGSIVINFDVLENGLAHGLPCGESFTVDQFHLERVEETLGTGIVVAVALGAHAA